MEQTQAPETREARPRRIRLHHPGRFKNFTLGLMCATLAVFGALVMVALAHTPKVNNEIQAINSTTTTGGDSTTAAIIAVTAVTGNVPTPAEKVPHQEEEKGHVLPEVTAQSTTTLHSDENTTVVFTTTHISQISVVVKGNATSV
ncbi:hypothetical protein HER10_EVM0010652 [Colletotrichum scovillei]|uniref:Uncharacterized protein n=1 Tax=Colletotrichum scovillei TaxID=1209932 RepID=A0A9P7UB03_9PEZI|nr:uncharacterized protein HER10_EVM0010652 [Colletotrichum scovillei]KAF4784638.1 hypothetical protein HER10_EVM0010652 [Colletotrichum scovillei]KAG7044574.1 hypothetical protein JMJ77_0004036 [Colletotrichum scovillei]KAG7049285.1 hypothetical protein JMJ78_0013268 [Colletotrichum scovillei]KAG7064003.1 hypothetical protein JMJ76_0007051 [Colletotrichum scovillei]